jgi:ornithine--oxo-acid transaminase
MGEHLLSGLRSIRNPLIKEIRGKGLMIGVELQPEAGNARSYSHKLMSLGILCKDTHEHTLRFAPPLVITRQEIDWALDRLGQVLLHACGIDTKGGGHAGI